MSLGYHIVKAAETEEELARALAELQRADALTVLESRTAVGSRADLGRPTTTPAENKENSDKTETEGANEEITEITEDTKLKDLLRQHPFLKKRLAEITPSFRMLQTPLGKLVASRATIKMMSEKSGLAIERIINGITDIIKDEAQKQKANK